jgi:hypothetical protein
MFFLGFLVNGGSHFFDQSLFAMGQYDAFDVVMLYLQGRGAFLKQVVDESYDIGIIVHVETDVLVLFQETLRVENLNGYSVEEFVQAHPLVHIEIAPGSVLVGQHIDVLQQ